MGTTQQRDNQDLGFEVEIKTSGRAHDRVAPAPAAPVTLSPARAAAKERAHRRNLVLLAVAVVGILVIGSWVWISNPSFNTPSDAVARVNGEYIYDRDVTREVGLNKAAAEVTKSITDTQQTVPSEGSALETIIDRRIQLQDARKSGVTATAQEIDAAYKGAISDMGATEAEFSAALARYKLTLDDFKAVTGEYYLIQKYQLTVVAAGASTLEDKNRLINAWQTNLSQTSKVDRLKAPGPGESPVVGSLAPDFTLRDMSGHDVKLSSLRGKPVMINFWATWCPPCRGEIPDIVKMYNDTHKASNYEILGVATSGDQPTIQAFSQEFSMSFPVLPDDGNHVTSLYHVLPIPTTFFIDKDGIIRYLQVGPVDRPLMEKWLMGSKT